MRPVLACCTALAVGRVCVLRLGRQKITTTSGRQIYDEASLQTGNSTRDGRWFRACSKHRDITVDNAEDIPGSDANTIGTAGSGNDSAAELRSDAVLEPDTVVFDDAVSPEFDS